MKDLLSKEHYYHKIHTLLTKSSAHFPFYGIPPFNYNKSFKSINPPHSKDKGGRRD